MLQAWTYYCDGATYSHWKSGDIAKVKHKRYSHANYIITNI